MWVSVCTSHGSVTQGTWAFIFSWWDLHITNTYVFYEEYTSVGGDYRAAETPDTEQAGFG